MVLEVLAPSARLLVGGVLLDLLLGDPDYRAHPVRLMGWTLVRIEKSLRAVGWDGYGGGVLLFVVLATIWGGGLSFTILAINRVSHVAAVILQLIVIYSMLALHSLFRHCWRVESAVEANDLASARKAVALLVGRDTERMDGGACRRAAIESLGESLTDGFVSSILWYVIGGLPGIVLFKIVSTMDSMVGYKTPRYFRFGWCGARLDDAMNWFPARITWALISLAAVFVPGCSARKAIRIGFQQHALVPGPNSGWSEAAIAGALRRKLVGPIWRNGSLITELWLGDQVDPPLSQRTDVMSAFVLVAIAGLAAVALACGILFRFHLT